MQQAFAASAAACRSPSPMPIAGLVGVVATAVSDGWVIKRLIECFLGRAAGVGHLIDFKPMVFLKFLDAAIHLAIDPVINSLAEVIVKPAPDWTPLRSRKLCQISWSALGIGFDNRAQSLKGGKFGFVGAKTAPPKAIFIAFGYTALIIYDFILHRLSHRLVANTRHFRGIDPHPLAFAPPDLVGDFFIARRVIGDYPAGIVLSLHGYALGPGDDPVANCDQSLVLALHLGINNLPIGYDEKGIEIRVKNLPPRPTAFTIPFYFKFCSVMNIIKPNIIISIKVGG
jgi:hypothetical protein